MVWCDIWPYAPAILRFKISFPGTYPDVPPTVTFSTDIFHPLLTPLTTYVNASYGSGGVSSSTADEERLPPGGFGLRHGFPKWYQPTVRPFSLATPPRQARNVSLDSGTVTSRSSISGLSTSPGPSRRTVSWTPPQVSQILAYIRSCFDEESVLDSIPFECAANTSAWEARRYWRRHNGPKPLSDDDLSDEEEDERKAQQEGLKSHAKTPGNWDWEGVWEARTKAGINGSLAEPVLFGNAIGGEDIIHFLNMDEQSVQTVRENMKRSMDMSGLR
ncbi:MAG: hypothetical protein M1814_005510 [Vezdaea aestivalis]|nr:MAG: hypothetical protein M1814_005510 [Vezdaea aestivalis]